MTWTEAQNNPPQLLEISRSYGELISQYGLLEQLTKKKDFEAIRVSIDEFVTEGKNYTVAVCIVARKLLVVVRALWLHKTNYNVSFNEGYPESSTDLKTRGRPSPRAMARGWVDMGGLVRVG